MTSAVVCLNASCQRCLRGSSGQYNTLALLDTHEGLLGRLGRPGTWGAAPTMSVLWHSRVTYIEEVQLICLCADRVGKEESVALEPRDWLGRVLESDAWVDHDAAVCLGGGFSE